MRIVIALGGNAMTGPDGRARVEDQVTAAKIAMESVADLVASGTEVVLTHGNGPQVGNLLVKNELAASVVPPVPLDWCGAQTQATLGLILMNALDDSLRRRGISRPTATVVTRTRVDADDPGFSHPTKPIGPFFPEETAHELARVRGWDVTEDAGRGFRRSRRRRRSRSLRPHRRRSGRLCGLRRCRRRFDHDPRSTLWVGRRRLHG